MTSNSIRKPTRRARKNRVPRVSREDARRRRHEEWERAKAQSVANSNAVLSACLGLLRSAVSNGALKGRGDWTNRYGTREEFLLFVAAPDSLAWQQCLQSEDRRVRPWFHLSFEERRADMVAHCNHNYLLCSTQIAQHDGSGWYVIHRPDPRLTQVTPLFGELDALLGAIPPLPPDALREGRAVLRKAEEHFEQLLFV